MKALVIGGSGLLGGAVAAALRARDVDVVCVSRSTEPPCGAWVRGDVRVAGLGLDPQDAEVLRDGLTHIVSCFGSVDWRSGPGLALDLHERGTRNVLELAAGCPDLERLVHVSSVLALGRADGPITGDELELGQGFRSWYDYGKFLAERAVREDWAFPRRVVRLGPVLGVGARGAPSAEHGLAAIVPFLLRGYPISIADRGAFPSYVSEAATAGAVVAAAVLDDPGPDVWTFFDHRHYSVAQVLAALCSPWGVMPRLVDVPGLGLLTRLAAKPFGVPAALLAYAEPWVAIAPDVLSALPPGLPRCPDGYIEATGAALRARAADLMPA
jgi:nucleoside-diphosphate-sugar epimerase